MNLFRYAWRNLWRNRRRTAITLAAVTLNTAILIASYGLMEGMVKHMVASATNIFIGEVQIHARGYEDDLSFFKSIPDPEAILRKQALS